MKQTIGIIGFSILLGGFGLSAGAENTAERLGYPADSKLLIVHADDIGMCHAANTAFIHALEQGIIKCGSVMVPCPWFLEIAAYAREHPEVDLGLHLTHTSEWKYYRWGPVADKSLVPGLLDSDGFLFRSERMVAGSSNAKEVETEIRAQIERALAQGMKPTHMDSHMGTLYANQEFLGAAIRLSEEYDIPFMLFNLTPEMLAYAGDRKMYDQAFVDTLQKRGIPLIDALYSIHNTPPERSEEFYRQVIQNLKSGVSELIIHPADESQELQAITNSHKQRAADAQIFSSPEMKEFIESQGVILIGWKDLYSLWKQRTK